jgi:hypothetical protein
MPVKSKKHKILSQKTKKTKKRGGYNDNDGNDNGYLNVISNNENPTNSTNPTNPTNHTNQHQNINDLLKDIEISISIALLETRPNSYEEYDKFATKIMNITQKLNNVEDIYDSYLEERFINNTNPNMSYEEYKKKYEIEKTKKKFDDKKNYYDYYDKSGITQQLRNKIDSQIEQLNKLIKLINHRFRNIRQGRYR